MDISDKEILEIFRKKNQKEKAFDLLVKKYQERLYWHIRKVLIDHDDTDDVLQNVFIKVWQNLDKFREDSQLFTWLYRIATNESLSFIRKRKNNSHISWDDVSKSMSEKLMEDIFFEGDEIQKKLQLAILSLPEKQRLVFNMKYFDEMKYEDMAEIMDTSVGALKASYHHAVKKIKSYFGIE